MFITKKEYEPENVEIEGELNWSCHSQTVDGNSVFVYVAGVGVLYEWRAMSNAKPGGRWKYRCDVRFVRKFIPPITIQELRNSISKSDWKPPHLNFRGNSSLEVPPDIAKHIRVLGSKMVLAQQDIEKNFAKQLKESFALSAKQRRRRLSSAPRKPKQMEVVSTAYVRNPDVVAEVLLRAVGKCEACKLPAPFLRASDGSPYLEVHHRIQLANGGDDTIENALALCPNCHREAHYGGKAAKFRVRSQKH